MLSQITLVYNLRSQYIFNDLPRKLQSEFMETARFLQLDFEKNESLARSFGVTNVPWLVLYKNGEKVWEANKGTSKDELSKQIKAQL